MLDQSLHEHHQQAEEEPADSLVILLHGLGADGRDLITLSKFWVRDLPTTHFVAPNAPEPCDLAPQGYQWFSLQDWSPETIEKGARNAAPVLNNYIDAQLEQHNLPAHKCALVGFSQGAMMALYVAPRRKDKLAGVLGYSGALLGSDSLVARPDDYTHFSVCLIHGEQDDVVPVQAYHHARDQLEKAGYDAEGFTVPGLAHGIEEQGMRTGADFLKKILGQS